LGNSLDATRTIITQKTPLLLFSLLLLFLSGKTFAQLKIFDKNSLATIEKQYTDQAFILVVWSIECLPCREELELISNIKKQYENINMVFLSTDELAQKEMINSILKTYKLLNQDNWIFKKSNSPALKFALDPNWYGELPRSYFYDSQHKRVGISGKLAKENVLDWVDQIK